MNHIKNNICGIYKITNLKNEKIYVGSSINIRQRWFKHLSELRNNTHCNEHLLNSYKIDGESCFLFEVLEEVEKEKLIEREQYYIDLYKCYDNRVGYNKRKIAESNLGHKYSQEYKDNMSRICKGRKHSDETKLKISKMNKGKKVSPESRLKMSLAKKGKPNHWKGKKRSEEQKKFLSEMSKKRTGIRNSNAKLTEQQVKDIRDMYNKKHKINDIAELFSISRSTVKRVAYKKSYKEIE